MTSRAIAIRALLLASGIAIGGVLLWLVLDSIDWPSAQRAFGQTDPGWVAAGIASFALGLAFRTWRWHRLVDPLGKASFATVGEALITGYAINNIVPARLGELYRAARLAHRAGLGRSAVLATIFVERLLDLIMVVALLGAGFFAVTQQSTALGAALAAAAILIALAIAGLAAGIWLARSSLPGWLLERTAVSTSMVRKAARRVLGWIDSFTRTLNALYTPRLAVAAIATVPIWIVESVAIMAILRAVGIDIDLAGLILTVAAGSLSTLIPSAPGFLGSYQFAYILALGLLGIDATLAAVAASSVVIYLIGGVTILGLALLAAGGWRSLRLRAAS